MEFVEHNLRALLCSQQPLNPDLVRSYAFQLLACLAYLTISASSTTTSDLRICCSPDRAC
jgi:hypothetical protein